MARTPNYGIDAPYVVRNLFLAGPAFIAVALLFPHFTIGHITFIAFPGFLWPAAWFFLGGVLMLLYSLAGKFRHRNRMLDKVSWRGDEMVLDIGTGRGLLLIGAARRLASGHAIGIDIWNAEDLTGNNPDAVKANVEIEGVAGRVSIRNEDARQMTFPDASFDVVLSNLCLHNIYEVPGRHKACREIARVLKPGGVAVISDFRHLSEYARELQKCGLKVAMQRLDWTGTFPPLRMLVARKPVASL